MGRNQTHHSEHTNLPHLTFTARAGLERRDACFISLVRVDEEEDDDAAVRGGGSGRIESGLETERLQHRR